MASDGLEALWDATKVVDTAKMAVVDELIHWAWEHDSSVKAQFPLYQVLQAYCKLERLSSYLLRKRLDWVME